MAAGRALKVVAATAGAALGLAVAACAVVAPRRGTRQLDACWGLVRRHRYADGGLASAGAPKGSLAAFARARELGFGVRVDVRLTLDGELVAFSDETCERACGRAGAVERMTLAELGELRLEGTGECVPTLDEVLRLFEPGAGPDGPRAAEVVPVVVTLRPSPGAGELLAERAVACLDCYDVCACVESPDPSALRWLRARRPDVLRGQVVEDLTGPRGEGMDPWRRLARTALATDALTRPDYLSCRFSDRGLPAVRLAAGPLGARLLTWAVGCERDLLASEALGAPAVFEGFVPEARSSMAP